MDARDRLLRRELLIVVIAKLLIIGALWWHFIRDAQVGVDDAKAASHFVSAPASNKQGENNAQ